MLSIFDIIKIGIGPSSSHTMGPWKAALAFMQNLRCRRQLSQIKRIQVILYGSLAKTGKGHGSDIATAMGLMGYDYITVDPTIIPAKIEENKQQGMLAIDGHAIGFQMERDIIFDYKHFLPYHPNGMKFIAETYDGQRQEEIYYSVGGGFIVQETSIPTAKHAAEETDEAGGSAEAILSYCQARGIQKISEFTYRRELVRLTGAEIDQRTQVLWHEIKDSIYRGLQRTGELPGGLRVKYRSGEMAHKLLEGQSYSGTDDLFSTIQNTGCRDFSYVGKWISCFAMAVNEENASFGRIITSPTNGASGIMPAVIAYAYNFTNAFKGKDCNAVIRDFMLTAGQIGCLFKKNATISGAMGGCQAEVGVSCAMCAAGLTELLGGSVAQVLQAAEIGMEHHLGLTCDPIKGLVQIPCIERNSMGAIKAVTASNIALEENPEQRLIGLDTVIKSMMETALDMNTKYKETSEAGLAAQFGHSQTSSC